MNRLAGTDEASCGGQVGRMGNLERWRRCLGGWGDMVALAARRVGGSAWWQAGCTALVELVLPPHCVLCAEELPAGAGRFCESCATELTRQRLAPCPRCARPVPRYLRATVDGCPACRGRRLWFQRALALGVYGGAMRELVLRMKQGRHDPVSLAAGELLADVMQRDWPQDPPELVVPVPMHWLRRLVSGANHAELIAEAVSDRLGIPLCRGLAGCRRRTQKQGTLTPAERAMNVRGAFGVRRTQVLAGRHVVVIDDVMTTGATANEIAKALRRGGARAVSVAVVARGIGFM